MYSCVIIESSDTDVAVMALTHSASIPCRLVLLTGRSQHRRHLDINKMVDMLGSNVTKSLIGPHAFSGCDSLSSFAGKGKKSHFKLAKTDPTCAEAMTALGAMFNPTDELYFSVRITYVHFMASRKVVTSTS